MTRNKALNIFAIVQFSKFALLIFFFMKYGMQGQWNYSIWFLFLALFAAVLGSIAILKK
jgi:heme/copper-type cytochrome/quinol oxidase subunit 4